MHKLALALVVATVTSAPAHAFCSYGAQTRPGSIGPGQSDNSRFYTMRGGGGLSVDVVDGGPITANLGCGWSTGYSHYCRRGGSGRMRAKLQNRTGGQILYRFTCFD